MRRADETFLCFNLVLHTASTVRRKLTGRIGTAIATIPLLHKWLLSFHTCLNGTAVVMYDAHDLFGSTWSKHPYIQFPLAHWLLLIVTTRLILELDP